MARNHRRVIVDIGCIVFLHPIQNTKLSCLCDHLKQIHNYSSLPTIDGSMGVITFIRLLFLLYTAAEVLSADICNDPGYLVSLLNAHGNDMWDKDGRGMNFEELLTKNIPRTFCPSHVPNHQTLLSNAASSLYVAHIKMLNLDRLALTEKVAWLNMHAYFMYLRPITNQLDISTFPFKQKNALAACLRPRAKVWRPGSVECCGISILWICWIAVM